MIHIATVHWKTARWIPIQRRFLKRNLSSPFLIHAHLEGVGAAPSKLFDFRYTKAVGGHSRKLNFLARTICDSTHPEDILIFLDGDAFPIAPFIDRLEPLLPKSRLIAIQTRENNGDIQPHPAFCMTTVGFWKEIRGDWRNGEGWINSSGHQVSDTGGLLLGILSEKRVPWHPLLRSNRRNLHPLWFGVYDGFLYHHGAGFRDPFCREDVARLLEDERLVRRNRQWILRQLAASREVDRDESPLGRALRPVIRRSKRLSDSVYARIAKDEDFFEVLMGRKKSRW